jgi:hypothetical protein
MIDRRINKDGQARKPKTCARDELDHIWIQACQVAKTAREQKQRCERAMLAAGQRAVGAR